MKQEFEMSMIGELTYFLGMQVKQTSEGIFISQAKYAKDLVKRFGLDGKSHARTPMSTNLKISADLTSKQVDPILYRSMIDNLLYLTASWPNIAFSVGVCAWFQANPKESHLTVVKHIIKYVNATVNYDICFSRETNLVLAGYSDADWAVNANDRKSTWCEPAEWNPLWTHKQIEIYPRKPRIKSKESRPVEILFQEPKFG
jgi:hypothetical protein